MLFSAVVITQFNLYTNICFYKYVHFSGAKGSPDIILNAFDVKFHDCHDGIPSTRVDPQHNFKKSKEANNPKKAQESAVPARPRGGPGSGGLPEKLLGGA